MKSIKQNVLHCLLIAITADRLRKSIQKPLINVQHQYIVGDLNKHAVEINI